MFEEIFLSVEKRIAEQVPDISYIAEDWGQLDFYQNHPPVQWPCLLYDIAEFNYEDMGERIQDGEGTISIRLADYNAVNMSALAQGNSPALSMFRHLTNAYKALQGLQGETFTGLRRIKLTRVRREDGIREYEMIFKTTFVDTAATPEKIKVVPTGKITIG